MKLTNTRVAQLPTPEGKQAYHFDAVVPSFGVRKNPGGADSWFVQYRDPFTRRKRRVTIGRCNVMGADKARDEARKILGKVALKQDPFPTPTLTLEAAYDWYFRHHVAYLKASSAKHARTVWNNHTPKSLKRLPVEHIGRGDWLGLSDNLIAEGKHGMAAIVHRFYRSMLNKLEEYDKISVNVLARTPPRAVVKARDRVLTEAEEKAVMSAANRLAEAPQLIIMTLMLTGARANEIIELRDHEVDLEAGVLTIDADRIKTKQIHTITLPKRLRAMYELRGFVPRRDSDKFFAGLGGRTPSRAWLLKTIREMTGISDHRLHDYRRTMATRMAETISINGLS